MKKINKENLRAMLGLTQQEIAGLLKVSRSLWAHFEGHRKNLPEDAGMRVNEMLLFMLSPEAKALKALTKPEYEENTTKMIFEKRLAENKYQLSVIDRKIAKEQEKFEKLSKAVQLMDFLNSPEQLKKAPSPQGLRVTTSKIIDNFKESRSKLRLLHIDLQLLQKEKLILEAAIEKLVNIS